MAEYWRFQDRGQPAPAHLKRPRAEYEEMQHAGPNYVPREEPQYDNRDGRFPWVDPGAVGMPYAPGSMPGADVPGAVGAPYMGVNGSGPLADPKLGMPPMNDPQGQGRMMPGMELGHGMFPGMPGPAMAPPDSTHTLYVEGLPVDCSRREAAHIFRPFIGFKDVRLVRKQGKRDGDPFVLCFVDFVDPKSASIALEALQGYKFDESDRDSPSLRLQYSRYPHSRSGGRDGPRDRDVLPPNRPFRH
ncbi:hypothetical protein KP509_09G015200 [Ceratopteris richardii]|nr:hypothetical protein KP509_09G015200 [Ceratopteris richardii]